MGQINTPVQAPALPRYINAGDLKLALVARKANLPGVRWMAVSNGVYTGRCEHHWRPTYRLPVRPLFLPIHSGVTGDLVDRVHRHGKKEVQRTWGIGYRALLAEVSPKRTRKATA